MRLRSQVLDALYLNWALPVAALPEPPAPLRYQTRFPISPHDGAEAPEMAFASALLFHHQGVHLPSLPFLRVSYPQLNLRVYVLDGDRVPSVLFIDMLMPWWMGPAVRAVAQGPSSAARFSYPRPSADPAAGEWAWSVDQTGNGGPPARLRVTGRRGSGLAMTATAGGAAAGNACTALGSWRETVRFFRERPRGYVVSGGRLRRVETEHPQVEVWPMTVEVEDDSLLRRVLPLAPTGDGGNGETGGDDWPRLHSAWLCPRIPFVFDLNLAPAGERAAAELDATLPQPASTRSAQPAAAASRRSSLRAAAL